MRIGILTGGGDAPGLNGVIEASCRALIRMGHNPIGILDGFEGVFEGRTRVIIEDDLRGLHAQAGTFLGTSNKCGTAGREAEFIACYQALKLDGVIAAGGDGTFAGLKPFEKEMPLIGVPKTIDNDLAGTDVTFGFDTACTVVSEAVEALRATAEAHRRVIVVEVMGRNAGWIALGGGLAGYADAILIPERPYHWNDLVTFLKQRKNKGDRGLVLVAAEGAHPKDHAQIYQREVKGSPEPMRLGGIGHYLNTLIEPATGWEARQVVLGHLQRARSPTTADRFLTLSLGVEAARLVHAQAWGKAVVVRKGEVVHAPISDLMQPPRIVPESHKWLGLAQSLGIYV